MDIMVNGTSVASGWGHGKEDLTGFNTTTSWPHFFANKVSANALWNHSLPSKSTDLTFRDQYNFCKQYISAGGNPADLMCMIEFSLPANPMITQFETKNEIIFPVLIHNDPRKLEHRTVNSEWSEFFVSSPRKPDYLSGSIYTPIRLKQHHMNEYFRVKHEYFVNHSLSARLTTLGTQIAALQTWLSEHGFSYLMFWAAGDGDSHRKFIDRSLIKNMTDPVRYIPMQDFTSVNWGAAQSVKHINNHPDATGNKRIAEYLFEQTTRRKAWPKAQLIQV